MKSKHYWQRREDDQGRLFDLPRRITERINACRKASEEAPAEPAIRYIWIHLSNDGLRPGSTKKSSRALTLDDWLNIIDESAALGAEWVVIYVGASLKNAPVVWDLCKWSQDVHELNVGLHLRCDCLSDEDVDNVMSLDRDRTFLVADGDCMDALRPLVARGVQVCKSDLHLQEKLTHCSKPADMCCTGSDGNLFSCGLVLGESDYSLGSVHERPLGEVITDASLPHAIFDASRYPTRGCEGCPPYIAEQIDRQRGAK